jgi:dUTP pyrophosphatase
VTVNDNELLFSRIRPDAIIPSKREEDAAYDIYANFDDEYRLINPHSTELIPTGIASAFSTKYYIQIEERGSTGCKGIKKSAGVIDSGYRNEWFIVLHNVNEFPVVIVKDPLYSDKNELVRKFGNMAIVYPYAKAIAQAIVHEVPVMKINEIDYNDLINIKSERGIGSLGSSLK